jgi:hypothetical protein
MISPMGEKKRRAAAGAVIRHMNPFYACTLKLSGIEALQIDEILAVIQA